MKLKTLSIAFLATFLLLGCTEQRKCQRFFKKHPKCFTNDTTVEIKTIKGDSFNSSAPIRIDSFYADSIIREIKDTCISKDEVREILRRIPCIIDPINKDTATYSLKIWVDNGLLKFKLKIKDRQFEQKTITNTPKLIIIKEKPKWLSGLLISLIVFIILLLGLVYLLFKK